MPFATPSSRAWNELLVAELASCLGVVGRCSNRRRGPAASRRACPWRPESWLPMSPALARDAGHDHHEDPRAERDDRRGARSAAPRPRGTLWRASHATSGESDRRDHAGGDHRQDDRVRERQDPDGADEEQEDADEQPRRQAEIAQPAGRGEGVGQIGRLAPADLVFAAHGASAGRTRRRAPWPSASRTRPA